jgi:succinate dehydrogenase / fumarate reductase cytochrome b subunit
VLQTRLFLFYVVGLIAASWHFAYGIWLFAAKWGIVSGQKAQKRFLIACIAFFFVLTGAGLASLTAFRSRPQQPIMEPGTAARATSGPASADRKPVE